MQEEDGYFLDYIELCCFLSAYFRLHTLREDTDWYVSAQEIVTNCTPECVCIIIQQIDSLLDQAKSKKYSLVQWTTRCAAGWQCRTDADAKHCLLRLRQELVSALQYKPASLLLRAA